jgi:hypothetical protein
VRVCEMCQVVKLVVVKGDGVVLHRTVQCLGCMAVCKGAGACQAADATGGRAGLCQAGGAVGSCRWYVLLTGSA